MTSGKNFHFGPYSNTVTVLVLGLLLLALALTIRTMQEQTAYNQYAASNCIIPPACVIQHTCMIPQPRQGWCSVTPSPLSPTPM